MNTDFFIYITVCNIILRMEIIEGFQSFIDEYHNVLCATVLNFLISLQRMLIVTTNKHAKLVWNPSNILDTLEISQKYNLIHEFSGRELFPNLHSHPTLYQRIGVCCMKDI